MDAVKFLKEQARMCRANDNCSTCPLKEEHAGTFCTNISDNNLINRKIEVVEKWSREHPVKTRVSEFLKQYPNARIDADGVPYICSRNMDAERECPNSCQECRHLYWLEEIE